MGQVLGIVYRVIATHLTNQAGFSRKAAHTGAVTLIQPFGSAITKSHNWPTLSLTASGVPWNGRDCWSAMPRTAIWPGREVDRIQFTSVDHHSASDRIRS
jgi:hypothetical protein